jgi:hypothetical protein
LNIFILSTDPKLAVQMQCNKRVIKTIVESDQLLSAAHSRVRRICVVMPAKHFGVAQRRQSTCSMGL